MCMGRRVWWQWWWPNLATKRAAATAVGLTSIFGYASTTLSGYGLGWLVTHYSWGHAFGFLMGAAVLGAALFAGVAACGGRGGRGWRPRAA